MLEAETGTHGLAGPVTETIVHDVLYENARLYPMGSDATAADATCFAVRDGRFSAVGDEVDAARSVDLGGRIVLPGLVDCHTHLVYAGDRAAEHAMRLAGASYEAIARAGGGIVSTVSAVRKASEAELVEAALPRAAALMAEGVTTLEIKSGYGLDLENELKMLRAIRRLDEQLPIDVRATFLGAHTVPRGMDRPDYMSLVIDDMLPAVASDGLADAVDIFVENIGFGLDDLRRLADAAADHSLALRVHAEQLSAMGGSGLGASLGALSCDHLEYASDQDIAAMAGSGTVAVMLPGAFYFLRETRRPPVEALRRAGVPMAVASDMNPGSSPVASLLVCAHMACTLFGMTAEETLRGITCHAAAAMGAADTAGVIDVGRPADFTVWDLPSADYLVYQLGGQSPESVFVGGNRL
jgi:imidazolonepropionase